MCLKHEQFRKWFSAKENTKDILAVIIDEGHCISQWGGDFRPTYSQLEKLRAFVPSHIPILLTSATFPPRALADTCDRLHISPEKSFFLNLGNHRANIAPSVIHMDSSKDYEAIHKILPDPNKITTADDFEKTIIFTNTVNSTQVICRDLWKRYGRQWHHYIDFLHANRTAKAKQRVMKLFRKGKIKILVATEAAGMVCEHLIPHFTAELIPKLGCRHTGHQVNHSVWCSFVTVSLESKIWSGRTCSKYMCVRRIACRSINVQKKEESQAWG
jgi:bloom syndrome protein